MPSISQTVRQLIRQKPLVYEGLIEGVISHAALAEKLQPDIEKDLGRKVKLPAIVMAIRRYNEKLDAKAHTPKDFKYNAEVVMKTGLADVTIVKSPTSLARLKQLYSLPDYDRGETLNIIHGNYEITIVISEKHLVRLHEVLDGEKVLNIEKDLVSLSISFSSDFLHTPGILAKATRKLAWENINIYENISTMTELIFIIAQDDAVRAYKALKRLVEDEAHP